MATINRFARPVQKDYSWVNPQIDVFEPNYNLWLDTLDKQQALYDSRNNIVTPEHLREDSPFVAKSIGGIEGLSKQAVDLYTSGDVSAGNRLLRQAQQKQVELWRPGGQFYQAKQNYTQYSAFAQKQKERLEKGEITSEQYKQSVESPLAKYGQQGGLEKNAQLNLLGRTNAINPDEFLQDYLKNYESDLTQSGYKLSRENGKLVYRKSETEKIDYDEVLKDSKSALSNAMSQTGQLQDMLDVRTGGQQMSMQPHIDKYTQGLTSQQDVKNKLSTLSNPELITYFESKGITGVNKNNVGALKTKALEQTNAQISSFESKIKDLNSITDPNEINKFNRDYLTDNYLTGVTKPYASAKSFEKSKTFQDVYSDPYVDFSLDKQLAKFKQDLENPFVPPTTGYTEAFNNPLLADVEPLKIGIDGKLEPSERLKALPRDTRTMGTLADEKYGTSNVKYQKDDVSQKENELFNQVKISYKNLYNKDLTDRQAVDLYNQMVEKTKSQSITFDKYNDDKEREAATKRILGSENKIVNVGVRPVYIVTPDGNISEPMTAAQANATLGNKGKDVTIDKGIEGKISARNPLGLPTGDYATIADSQGNQVTVIIGNRSIEEDRHFGMVNKLSKPTFSLQTEIVPITDQYGRETGERFVSEPVPIIRTSSGKPVFEGTDAKITKYDAYGNVVELAPGVQSISLSEYEKLSKTTNPYK